LKHPDLAVLLYWLDEPERISSTDFDHLRSGCDYCRQRLAGLAASDALLGASQADSEAGAGVEDDLESDLDPLVARVQTELGRWQVEAVLPTAPQGVRGAAATGNLRAYQGDGYDATVQIRSDLGAGGEIRGRLILGAHGGAVPSEVFLTSEAQPVTSGSVDGRGRFRLRAVPAGFYELRFFLDGFREIVLSGVQVAQERDGP
jgi:hypothetical protein